MRGSIGWALPILAATAAHATPAQTAATTPARRGLQAEFDAASEAKAKGDCRTAVALFAGLAANPTLKPGTVPAAAIALRRGVCLVALGEDAAGETLILEGLPTLRAAGATFVSDVADGEMALGDAANQRWDHDGTVAHDKAALALLTGAERIGALSRLAKATAFDGGTEPIAYADEALAIALGTPGPDKAMLAALHALRARIVLNQGNARDALAELRKALDLAGGLTQRISLSEAVMRSDLAQAAMLAGSREDARKYMAYTGAGRISQEAFAAAEWSELPQCGAETGLAPDDLAIVEFAIGDDGHVISAQTVYSRGDYVKAAAFARAVSEWYWRPEAIAKIPPFYKAMSRIELRCSMAGSTRIGIEQPLAQRFTAWAGPVLGAELPAGADIRGNAAVRRLMNPIAQQASDPLRTAAAIGILAIVEPSDSEATVARLTRAVAQAQSAGAPADATGFLLLRQTEAAMNQSLRKQHVFGRAWIQAMHETFAALARNPLIAADPLARDTVEMLSTVRPHAAEDEPLLRAVADDRNLGEHHPLRQAAWLRLANLAASQHDLAAAQSDFERTGLTEQQCSLIGVAPARTNTNASFSKLFPQEALNWGFEGWVKAEFDIRSDGSTAHSRTVVAYPPFIFADAAQKWGSLLRYERSFRPSGGTACSAKDETVSFHIFGNH